LPFSHHQEPELIKGIYHAAAGMLPRMSQQETVGNNLANVNTTGFKADQRFFRTSLNNSLLQGGKIGQNVKFSDDQTSLVTDFSQGSFSETRNPLDVSINGDGFFVFETGDSLSFSRNGSFAVNGESELVNNRGYRVMGEEGPIRITGHEITFRADGGIIVDGKTVGTLKIIDFEQPYALKRNGYGYFIPDPPDSGFRPEKCELRQGFLEDSNVDAISEMIQMIELNRNYESCQKAIQAQDDTLKLAVNELPK
jgi:flagellar basal-body rod protein FlgG